eukprot:COSAG05_NODE_1042_length_6066_cov_2.922742_4_plen_461_part_00
MSVHGSAGRRDHGAHNVRLPALAASYASEGETRGRSSINDGDDQVVGQQAVTGGTHLSLFLEMVERLRSEYQGMLDTKDKQLAQKDKQYRDDIHKLIAQKDKQYRDDIHKLIAQKDKQYRDDIHKLTEEHRQDMQKKDEQLAKYLKMILEMQTQEMRPISAMQTPPALAPPTQVTPLPPSRPPPASIPPRNSRRVQTAAALSTDGQSRASGDIGNSDTNAKELWHLRLTELRARAKDAGYSAELLEDALDCEEPKAAVIKLLLHHPTESAAPEQEQEPQSQPQRQVAPTESSSVVNSRQHPVYRALESHQLEAHFEKLLALGVKRVEDLREMSQEDVDELQMKKFDRKKFVSAFLAETPHHHEVPPDGSSKPHHGVASSKEPATITVGGFSFEDGKHAMFSYQWDSQAEVVSVREYFASLGIPTWMVSDSTALVVMACYILVCWLHRISFCCLRRILMEG